MTDAPPNATSDAPDSQARRMLAALIGGAGIEAIAAEWNLPAARVEAILRDELGRRRVAPVADFAKIQIARLENLFQLVIDRAERGELRALDRALRIFNGLDRYHGFHRASPAVETYGEEQRERLLAKLNAAASRLFDEPQKGDTRE